jgi:hypothetical protein
MRLFKEPFRGKARHAPVKALLPMPCFCPLRYSWLSLFYSVNIVIINELYNYFEEKFLPFYGFSSTFSRPGGATASNHQHQFLPATVVNLAPFVKRREFEGTRFQSQMVQYQPSALHVQYFHTVTATVDEDEYFTLLHSTFHVIGNKTREGMETFTHIRRGGIEIVAHLIV